MKANIISWIVVVVFVIVAAVHFSSEPWPPLRIAGAAICLAALVLISIARYQLGRSFSVTAQARRLVTTGLYSRIRNPIYFFAEFLFLGIALFLPAWWPLLLMVGLIPIQMMRARREAAVLEAAFGDEYVRYRRSTWF